jgi:tetratricopeptide (TPR) repeat protein
MGLITPTPSRALLALLTLLVSALLALAPVEASAQRRGDPRERQARALFDQGSLAYEEGRYEEAISAFEQAYGLSARPLLLYNIANAQERLGLLSEALDNLRYYREDAPSDEIAVLDRRIRGLEDRVARQQREEERRRADQEQIARSAAEAAAAAAVREGGARAPDAPPAPVLGWSLTIGGGVLAAAGIVFGVLALGARSDAEALCSSVGERTLCPDAAASALSRDSAFSILADVGMIAGAALVAVGLYLVITHDPETPRAPSRGASGIRAGDGVRLSLGFGPRPGGGALLLRGTL